VKSPECFVIERRLRAEMQSPLFHDDQHGTAIHHRGRAESMRWKLAGKRIEDVKVVFVGAGAAAVACAEQYVKLGVPAGTSSCATSSVWSIGGGARHGTSGKACFAQGAERALSKR